MNFNGVVPRTCTSVTVGVEFLPVLEWLAFGRQDAEHLCVNWQREVDDFRSRGLRVMAPMTKSILPMQRTECGPAIRP